VIATDIAHQQYPLLLSPKGEIDFNLTQSKVGSATLLFTTLLEITYRYSKAQVIDGQGLTALTDATHGTIELLMPRYETPFSIFLQIRDNAHQVLSEREIKFAPKSKSLPQGQLVALLKQEATSTDLHINYKTAKANLAHITRAKIIFDVPMQPGLEYAWQEACLCGQEGKTLRLTQLFGLSHHAALALMNCIIPQEHFTQLLLAQKKETSGTDFIFNRFEKCPNTIAVLYNLLQQGLINRSVPLFALQKYFVKNQTIGEKLLRIDLTSFDKHDQFVIKQLYKLLIRENETVFEFMDEVDKLLSLRPEQIETRISLAISGKVHPQNELLHSCLYLENAQGETIHRIFCKTQVIFLEDEKVHEHEIKGINEAPLSSKQESTKGGVYKVSLANVTQGEHVIEGFNWRDDDKINLSELLNLLKENEGGSSVVHAQITQNGDTEIWVEHFGANAKEAQHYHIATLKGVQNLPLDLNSIIEHRR
jgi:hypothetical protein